MNLADLALLAVVILWAIALGLGTLAVIVVIGVVV